MRHLLACAAVFALAMSPAAAGQGAPDPEEAGLQVRTETFGSTSLSSVLISSSDSLARFAIAVPQGYSFDLGVPAGTEIGGVVAFVGEPGGDIGGLADGVLTTETSPLMRRTPRRRLVHRARTRRSGRRA